MKKTERIKIALTVEEKLTFEKIAKEKNTSVSQLFRTLVEEYKNKKINETAIAINSVQEMIDKRMAEFAKSQDMATRYLMANAINFYETRIEKMQEKIDAMAPYIEEANKIIAAREAVLRKQRGKKRSLQNG